MTQETSLSLGTRLGRWAYGTLLLGGIQKLLRGLRHWPSIRPERRGVVVERDVPYQAGGHVAHRLDIYRPAEAEGPLPVVLYVHGGGFRYFSKDTHWAMATAFAERGFLVYNIEYRLAPMHRYPAAFEDVAAACAFALKDAPGRGADLGRMVWAGESAGGNLALSLAVAACWEHSSALETTEVGRRLAEASRRVFEAGPPPAVLLPACGYLEVSRPERHYQSRAMPGWIQGRIHEVSNQYLPDHATPAADHLYANPIVFLEAAPPPDRPFPATFGIVGDKDPVMGDTVRLPDAVSRLGAVGRAKIYPGGMHAFHGLWWKALAKEAWRDQFAFIDEHLPPPRR